MKTYQQELKQRLDIEEKYREMLFRRGYLFTSKRIESLSEYPFYNLWNFVNVGKYYLYVQKEQTFYTASDNDTSIVLIGHAYNPFNLECDENKICYSLLEEYKKGLKEYFDKVSELTGLHLIILVKGDEVIACQDACGLTGCYFGTIEEEMYISEHPQLIADICGLPFNKTVEKLVTSKCYNIGNRHLPGNITPYDAVKRLGGNTYLNYLENKFEIKRFYPLCAHPEFVDADDKQKVVQEIAKLVHNGIACAQNKWERCAISLTGGTDSKTTLACANGLYDKFNYFSFISKPQEKVDADGAKMICEKLGLEHTLIPIPENNEDFADFDFIKTILLHNGSYFHNLSDNEIRKYITLHDLNKYDIELKSWASEVARVFFERKYKIRMPKRLNERHCSIFQTRYFLAPRLLRWSDKVYNKFLKEIGLNEPLFNYEHTDSFYWEVRMGAWGVSVISSQQLYHRTSIPMNNRRILELFLSLPREDRIDDSVHKQIMDYMNPNVEGAKVEIKNLYFHSYRIWLEKIYFWYRTIFYRAKK